MFVKQFVQVQNLATDVAEKLRSEEGEVASQVIIMVALVAVALVIKQIGGILKTQATTLKGQIQN